MSSILSADDYTLALLNAQVNGSSESSLSAVVSAWMNRTDETAIGVCGFSCLGDCQTCTQSNADLQAFFAPDSVVIPVVAPALTAEASASIEGSSSAAEDAFTEIQVVAQARDEADEVARTGVWADSAESEYEGDCDCLECRTGHVPENWFNDREDDDYDDGCGLDWNESGYFD